jgi:hypothetical protein
VEVVLVVLVLIQPIMHLVQVEVLEVLFYIQVLHSHPQQLIQSRLVLVE